MLRTERPKSPTQRHEGTARLELQDTEDTEKINNIQPQRKGLALWRGTQQ